MTIVFSAISHRLIAVTVDTVETRTFEDGAREYENDVLKAKFYPGVGCVTTWGERSGNQVFKHLDEVGISSGSHSVHALQKLVSNYLREVYQPDKYGLGEANDAVLYQARLCVVLGRSLCRRLGWRFEAIACPYS